MRGGRAVPAARRAFRWCGRAVGLLVVVLLVTGIGVRVPEPEPPVYSASEQAQLDAERRFLVLATSARTAAARDLEHADLLTAIAQDLEAQADAVALPRSPAPAAPSPVPASPVAPSPVTPSPVPAADGAAVLVKLRTSALTSLHAAVDADAGPSRVLASAGANQWRHTALLAGALGAETGLPDADAVPPGDLAAGTGLFDGLGPEAPVDAGPPQVANTGAGTGAGCAGTPAGSASELASDRKALLSAVDAEHRARYGYEVAAALLPDPAPALTTAAVHGAAADAAAARLAEDCLSAAPAPAGFAVGPSFRADPTGALRLLEQDHAEFYADLVPSMSEGTRAWAVTSFNAAVQRSVSAGTPLEAFPGARADAADPADPADPADADAVVPPGPSGG